jgi:hypothetical protein
MKVVTPETKTTLLVNKNYQAFAFCNARAAIRHLMTGKAKGIDAAGNPISWNGLEDNGIQSSRSWVGNQVELHEDQPALRSAPNNITGEDTLWAIPTILVCSHRFGLNGKGCNNVSLRSLYNLYRGTCQYCLEKIPFHTATKDHSLPKSKGGTNDDFNLVLACKPCNNEKDSIFPYFNVNGEEVKPKRRSPVAVLVETAPRIRSEWSPYLHT